MKEKKSHVSSCHFNQTKHGVLRVLVGYLHELVHFVTEKILTLLIYSSKSFSKCVKALIKRLHRITKDWPVILDPS
jgi:hypothetical protein